MASLLPGSWGAAHIDELAPRDGEPAIVKYAYDAFVGTNLDTMLRSRGIDTLVMAGTDLNICVGDTLHHAFALGYHVVQSARSWHRDLFLLRQRVLQGKDRDLLR